MSTLKVSAEFLTNTLDVFIAGNGVFGGVA